MRRLLLSPLALLLVLAVPAFAATRTVEVGDDYFLPETRTAAVGDTVTWNWTGNEAHDVTSTPGKKQIEKFRSGDPKTSGTYSHTFENEGLFSYLCTEHADIMTGRVRVGTDDDEGPRIRRSKGKPYGDDNVKVVFRLSERAVLKVKLRGPEDKTVTRVKRAGKGSVRFRNLEDGDYKVALTAKDGFGNRAARKVREFEID